MSNSAFRRYAPFIQKYIYQKGWTDLRDVQVEACDAILDTNKHVIIASGTASGKTEAAFFPILTLLDQNPPASIGVMYISPLKALINDQFERLNDLLDERDIQVWPWHGDVSWSVKNKALKAARGILQITPESLEAMIMRHPGDAAHLFSDLRFIVIDEIHALMGEDRGSQVLCLIKRLEKLTRCYPRRVGLSATLNDYSSAKKFLAEGSLTDTVIVGIKNHKRIISLAVESFPEVENEDTRQSYYKYIYNNCYTKKCLIFAQSRETTEDVIAAMKQIARERNEKDIFYVHHGNISACLRQEAEHALRDNVGATVAAATLTLELGIDIGDLDSTIQLGAPYSCSSFVQRLGRSGRKTGKSQMLFVNKYKARPSRDPYEMLPWELLQSVAVIQLYLEERWVEPFSQKKKPYSLLAHQTLSVLMSCGELSPPELARNVLLLPPFKNTISGDEYRDLLRFMLKGEYIQRLENGGLIVGLRGERIANFYTFYAVFNDVEEYHVISKTGEIGTVDRCPKLDDVFVLAGSAWHVISIDDIRKKIYVKQAEGKKVPEWETTTDVEIDAKVIERIRKLLAEEKDISYLQSNAKKILSSARTFVKENGLIYRSVLPCEGKNVFYMCPWCGTRELKTIKRLLSFGLKEYFQIYYVSEKGYYLYISSALSVDEFLLRCREIDIDCDDPNMVWPQRQSPYKDKYDYMVPDNLLRKAFLHNQMDVPSAIRILETIGWNNGKINAGKENIS